MLGKSLLTLYSNGFLLPERRHQSTRFINFQTRYSEKQYVLNASFSLQFPGT